MQHANVPLGPRGSTCTTSTPPATTHPPRPGPPPAPPPLQTHGINHISDIHFACKRGGAPLARAAGRSRAKWPPSGTAAGPSQPSAPAGRSQLADTLKLGLHTPHIHSRRWRERRVLGGFLVYHGQKGGSAHIRAKAASPAPTSPSHSPPRHPPPHPLLPRVAAPGYPEVLARALAARARPQHPHTAPHHNTLGYGGPPGGPPASSMRVSALAFPPEVGRIMPQRIAVQGSAARRATAAPIGHTTHP